MQSPCQTLGFSSLPVSSPCGPNSGPLLAHLYRRKPMKPISIAKDQFGAQGADFIGVLGALLVRSAKDQLRAYLIDPTRLSGTPPCRRKRPVPASAILNPQATRQLEFHQLDRRWEHLRVRQPHLQRRLLASLAESGQQTPIVGVLSPDYRDRYLVIDGHKRIAALQQLGRDTVEATVWAMSAAEALPEMDHRQQEQAQRQIESARRELDRMAARIGKEQETQHAEPGTTHRDSGTECEGRDEARDRTRTATLAPDCAQSAALKLQPGSGNPTGGESRTLPPTDPGSVGFLQGESRASP